MPLIVPTRSFFMPPALEVAPQLLGAELTVDSPDGPVTVRISEIEAYHGVGTPGPYDGGSHSRREMTPRNAAMFGEPGHAYVYLSYGIHFAINVVCGPAGSASGVLLRAGTVIAGTELAKQRRRSPMQTALGQDAPERDLARGPGRLAQALAINRESHNGLDLLSAPFTLQLATTDIAVANGPRVGVSGEFGGSAFPWRFWVPGDRSVSSYRPGRAVTG